MPCTNPITAYIPKEGGQARFHILPKEEDDYNLQQIECRECLSCMQRIASDWTIRQACEYQTCFAEGIGTDLFITHTYNDENLPDFGHYQYADMQAFWKRLRSRLDYEAQKLKIPKQDYKLRYLTAAEYGDKTHRPHFHSTVFNAWIPDLRNDHKNKEGYPVLTSKMIDECWGKGHVDIQFFSLGTAIYVAQHQMKRNGKNIKRELKASYWRRHKEQIEWQKENGLPHQGDNGESFAFDPKTGLLLPEMMPLPRIFASSNPGIGKTWFDRFYKTAYHNGFITFRGRKYQIPRYFDLHMEKIEPEWFEEIKIGRELKQLEKGPLTREDLARIDQAKINKRKFFMKPAKI